MSQVLSQESARDIRRAAHDELVLAVQRSGRLPADLDESDSDRLNAAWDAAVCGNYSSFTNGWAERAVFEASQRLNAHDTAGERAPTHLHHAGAVRERARNELLAAQQWSGRVPGFFSRADGSVDDIRRAYDRAVGGDYQSYARGWAERAAAERGYPVDFAISQPDVVRDSVRAKFVEHLRDAVCVEHFGLDAETITNGLMDVLPEALFSSGPAPAMTARTPAAVSNLDERIAVDRASMRPEHEGAVYVAFERRTVVAYAIAAPNEAAALARARLALRPQGHPTFRAEHIAESPSEVLPESGRIVSIDELHTMLDADAGSIRDRYTETVVQRDALTKAFLSAAHESRSTHDGIDGFFYAPDIEAGINAILDGVGLGVRAFEDVSDERSRTEVSPPSL